MRDMAEMTDKTKEIDVIKTFSKLEQLPIKIFFLLVKPLCSG